MEKYTVVELKEALRQRGLKISGTKAELIARLEESSSPRGFSMSELETSLPATSAISMTTVAQALPSFPDYAFWRVMDKMFPINLKGELDTTVMNTVFANLAHEFNPETQTRFVQDFSRHLYEMYTVLNDYDVETHEEVLHGLTKDASIFALVVYKKPYYDALMRASFKPLYEARPAMSPPVYIDRLRKHLEAMAPLIQALPYKQTPFGALLDVPEIPLPFKV